MSGLYFGAMRRTIVLTALLMCAIGVSAQTPEPRIWQGVYTTAQADRGKTSYNSSCLRCHGDKLQGNTAPALSADRFFTTWGNEPIASLFAKIRDTMPPNFGTSIDDQTKLDIVAYILQTNGFPAGTGELTQNGNDLASAQILKKGEQAIVQNFSLVQAVGCLARGTDNSWMLTRTSDPLVTRDEVPSAQSLASAATRPLGTRTFRLLSAKPFNPESHQGHKMEARGLIYNEPGDERLTLTSLRMAGNCSE
jgi:S-disulfanyl-L-cysteine oxidoreductase SoxD